MKKKIIVYGSVFLLILCTVLIKNSKKNTAVGKLCINEAVTANGSYTSEDGAYPDWIEIYYEGEKPVNLEGYYLSDDKNDIFRWKFPSIELNPGEYLVVFASGRDEVTPSGEIHTNFKLDCMGESLYLSDPNGKYISGLSVPEIPFDRSFGMSDGTAVIFEKGSPMAANVQKHEVKTRKTTEIFYSIPAGLYAEEQILDLQTKESGARIYYTLDGSIPTEESFCYDGEYLTITERTSEENRYTSVWSSPYDWDGEAGYSYNPNPQYKATVVKTRLYFPKEDCWSEEIWTNTYLIGADYSLPVVSLSVEESALFDEETGICVPGAAYQKYMETATEINPEPRKRTGNYSSDRKVSGYLEYFTVEGNKVMENEITMRVCGNISRGSGMKSFAVYAWGDEQIGWFSYPVFGEDCKGTDGEPIERFTSLRLRNFGNDWRRSKIRDGLAQSLVEDLDLGSQAYQPAVVLINGEYYGLCEIRENRDEQYYEEHYEIPEEYFQEVKISDLYDQKETEAEKDFLSLISYAETHDLSNAEYAKVVEEQLNVEQFLDYVLIQLYLGNLDWHNNNCDFFRSTMKKEGSSYQDGRWRVLLYDLDYSINYQSEDHYTSFYESDYHNARLTRALLANDEWMNYYKSGFEELLQHNFEPSEAIRKQQQFEEQLAPEVEEDLKRWDVYLNGQLIKETSLNYWYEKMDDIRAFFQERPEYARAYFYASLEQFFGETE